MPGHERRRTRPPEHKSLAVKKGYTQNPLAAAKARAAKARAAAAEAAEPKKTKKAIDRELDTDGTHAEGAEAVGAATLGDTNLGDESSGIKAPKVAAPQRDSTGQLYITLAQVLKKYSLAPTGGAAKHTVRAGGITVNGTPEERPGRKLHAGDIVVVGGQTVTVDLVP